MKKIDDYTIGELKEIIQQREQKEDWKEKAKGHHYIKHDISGYFYAESTNYKYDNQYEKKSDAEIFAKKADLFNRMNLFALIHNEGWVADWRDTNQMKWGLRSLRYGVDPYCNDRYNCFLFGITVKSKEIARAMLEEFKDELEIYLK